jgi:hypothetical protein
MESATERLTFGINVVRVNVSKEPSLIVRPTFSGVGGLGEVNTTCVPTPKRKTKGIFANDTIKLEAMGNRVPPIAQKHLPYIP